MNTIWKTRLRTYRPVLILTFLLLFVGLGGNQLLTYVTAPLTRQNNAYLDKAIRDTTQLMIPVGLAKAGADMIEGSTIQLEAGIVVTKGNMTVEAGDLMQPILDCIEIAWKVLLTSAVFLISVKCIVSGFPELTQPLCIAFLLCYLINSLLVHVLKRDHLFCSVTRRIGGILLLCWILIVALLPLTLAGTAYLSERTTAHMQKNIDTTFQRVHTVFNMEGFSTASDLSEKATFLKTKMADISRFAREELSTVVMAICQLVAVKVISGVVYPLLMLAFLIWLIRGCLYPTIGLSEHSTAAADLQRLKGWIQEKESKKPE
jgi:uncharacterized membrane protein